MPPPPARLGSGGNAPLSLGPDRAKAANVFQIVSLCGRVWIQGCPTRWSPWGPQGAQLQNHVFNTWD
eukprot:3125011-Lingulodinium_polyedra.AAC.1